MQTFFFFSFKKTMIAASSYIDSEFKTEDGKAKWNQAILNSFFFVSLEKL